MQSVGRGSRKNVLVFACSPKEILRISAHSVKGIATAKTQTAFGRLLFPFKPFLSDIVAPAEFPLALFPSLSSLPQSECHSPYLAYSITSRSHVLHWLCVLAVPILPHIKSERTGADDIGVVRDKCCSLHSTLSDGTGTLVKALNKLRCRRYDVTQGCSELCYGLTRWISQEYTSQLFTVVPCNINNNVKTGRARWLTT